MSPRTTPSRLALFVLLTAATASLCQQLTVQSSDGKQVVLARSDIDALPPIRVTTGASDTPKTFEGVPLIAVLEKAGISLGETLKGRRLASCLLVEASDGYRTVIALPELDPAFTDRQIVLAFAQDGRPLSEREGPYRIVIPGEKKMARWVRQVTRLKIVDVQ